jgi:phospholipase D1/2
VLIADDQVVICGSANLNDRSQLGYHDSEIAIVVQDSTSIASSMAGESWRASAFAASLRRQLYRKHLGLLRPRDGHKPEPNSEPVGVPSEYDWGCPEDDFVADPLSVGLLQLWDSQAQKNTDVFRRVFHVVPDDNVRNWGDYKKFTHCFNHSNPKEKIAPGHVVRGDFSPGVVGATEVKDLLSQVKGTLVDMPLNFLLDEDVAKSGIMLNAFTEWIYT